MSWIQKRILRGDKGLGDTIERFTQATGIKNIVEEISKFTDRDCMCAKRKDILNEMFSYDKLSGLEQQKLSRLIDIEKFELKGKIN